MASERSRQAWLIDLYRAKAEEARRHADRVTDSQLKANWDQVAESWTQLADQTERMSNW